MFNRAIIDEIIEEVKKGVVRDSEDIIVDSRGHDGTKLALADHLKTRMDSSIPSGAGSVNDYTGPWAVIRKSDTVVTVKAQGTGYPCVSRVIAGLITTVHSTDADVTITTDGEVYLHVTVSGATYTLAFANAAALPDQAAGHYYVSLARVEFANSKIGTITQIKTSDIEISGRVV